MLASLIRKHTSKRGDPRHKGQSPPGANETPQPGHAICLLTNVSDADWMLQVVGSWIFCTTGEGTPLVFCYIWHVLA